MERSARFGRAIVCFMTALSFRSVFPEISPLYSTLKSAVKTQANMIAILCDPRRGGNALEVAKQFCPDAVPQIEKSDQIDQRLNGPLTFDP